MLRRDAGETLKTAKNGPDCQGESPLEIMGTVKTTSRLDSKNVMFAVRHSSINDLKWYWR